jgi:hypothetical protein
LVVELQGINPAKAFEVAVDWFAEFFPIPAKAA